MELEEPEFFHRQKRCLSAFGHSLVPGVKESLGQQFFKYFAILTVISAQYPMLNYGFYHRNDLILATASMSVDFTNLLTLVKILTFLANKTHFIQIMTDLTDMWKDGDRFASSIISTSNAKAQRMVNTYFMSVSCTGLYFMSGPLVKIAWASLTNKEVVKELPMRMRFFFSAEETPGYEFVYIYTALCTVTVVFHASAIDGFFISFAIHLHSHFRILQRRIETNSFRKAPEFVNADLCSYVKYHTKILALSETVCQTFRPIIFAQFLITSLQVCVIVYQLVSNTGNYITFIIYVAFLISILIQLLIYCYGGEILKIESLTVGTSIQLSSWYRLSPKHRRMLALMLQRSQKEVIIRAGFYDASLASFMTIIKAAMSYITLIQSIE